VRWRDKLHCPHRNLRGIYGDEILHIPGGRRLVCRDCGRLLDGPVSLAEARGLIEDDLTEMAARQTAAILGLNDDPEES
jgi:hypothetical protein